ncbi:stachyose synthase-like [Fagus crenata]
MAPPVPEAIPRANLSETKSTSRFSLSLEGNISLDSIILLSHVPKNVTRSNFSSNPHAFDTNDSPAPPYILNSVESKSENGAFLGLSVKEPHDRILNSIGKLIGRKYLSIFRFKTWWSTMWVGSNGSDLQMETQLVMLQVPEINSYALILPLIEENFRSAIHPGSNDDVHVILCVESGSTKVMGTTFSSCVYLHVGDNPYDLMRDAFKAIRVHLGTFRLLEEKTLPNIVDKFGWCSWDAFYLTVEPVGLWHGVKSFVENGFPPRFLIIDDGWQSINMDHEPPLEDSKDLTGLGSQMLCRLYKFKENEKFAKYQAGTMLKLDAPTFDQEKHDQKFKKSFHSYGSRSLPFHQSCPDTPFLPSCNPNQAANLYESMHSYLADVGVTGVKVDVIHTLEYVSENHGSRVQLAKAYYDGLTKSLKKNFGGSGLIASMEQCNDFFFLATKEISMGRVGDDFWFEDPNGDPMGVYWLQGVHMIHCSYNSLWQGQLIQPDWDMFQSDHLCAEFHAGSRAICGGPVYVSDKVGRHNFDLLRKLVLPDGTILKCQHYALPARDCLFENPLFDGKTLLKLWNLNKYAGVVGVFNCQGAGWYLEEHKCKAYPQFYKSISGLVSPDDVEWEQKDLTAQFRNTEQFAIYLHKADNLQLVRSKEQISLTVQPTSFEILTVSPVHKLNERAKFAPIGLENMFNSGGSIEFLEYGFKVDISTVKIKVKGSGKFLSYSSEKPKEIVLNGEKVEFEWSTNGILRFGIPWIGGNLSDVFISIS